MVHEIRDPKLLGGRNGRTNHNDVTVARVQVLLQLHQIVRGANLVASLPQRLGVA